jgi:hypothetical protein
MEGSPQLHIPSTVLLETTVVPTEYEDGWAPEAVWTVLENKLSFPTAGMRTLNRSACREGSDD